MASRNRAGARGVGAGSHLQDVAAGDDVSGREMLEDHAGERADVEGVHLDEVAWAGRPVAFGLADGVGAFGSGVSASDAGARGFAEESAPLRVGEDAPDHRGGGCPSPLAQLDGDLVLAVARGLRAEGEDGLDEGGVALGHADVAWASGFGFEAGQA